MIVLRLLILSAAAIIATEIFRRWRRRGQKQETGESKEKQQCVQKGQPRKPEGVVGEEAGREIQRRDKDERNTKIEEPCVEEGVKQGQEGRLGEEPTPSSKGGGGPRGSKEGPEIKSPQVTRIPLPRPEIVCWKEGWNWVIGIEVTEEIENLSVIQNGEPLEQDNENEIRFRLKDIIGKVRVTWNGGGKDVILAREAKKYLVFKMRKEWKEPGRLVKCPTSGYYLIIVPQEWIRDEGISGSAPIKPENVQLVRYKAHFFNIEQNRNTSIGFITENGERILVETAKISFQLVGKEIEDASDEKGPLFGEQAPRIQSLDEKGWDHIGMIVIGKEGRGKKRWRRHYNPQDGDDEQKVLEELTTRRGGWYFVRVYDGKDDLIESMDFRFMISLKGIQMDNYDSLPGKSGHDNVIVKFHHHTSCKIELADKDILGVFGIHYEDGQTIITLPPIANCDKTRWILCDGDAEIDTTVLVERIWWCVGTIGVTPTNWVDKPISLSCKDFVATSNKALWLKFPRARFINKVELGFERMKRRSYQVEVEEKEFSIPLCDFCDAEEIQNSKQGCLFQLFIDSQNGTNSVPLLRIFISFRCKNCEFITNSEEELSSHISVHLDELIPHLSYEELYQRSGGTLPFKIYKCSYCNVYVKADDISTYPDDEIYRHLKDDCPKALGEYGLRRKSFRIVDNVDEVRENINANLPHIYRCQICNKEFEGDNMELRLEHIQNHNIKDLFEIF